ncbi:MAG: aminoacyl-tRNA hydrolase [Clostridia bacterium]|nr:aminoacyl-tRNA hydrolase [Clostridia bacterium]
MYLIVGLGNPESDYSRTRHNMGFDVINKLAEKFDIKVNKSKFKALYGTGTINGEKVILVKPQTFMNLSGEAVQEFVNFYKINLDELIVIYDDIDTTPGKIRIRKTGGPGTHNGMKSVVSMLNSEEFMRVRVGIGMPEFKGDLINYVIGHVPDEEYEMLQKGVAIAAESVEEILKNGIDIAMNKYN